MGSLREGCKEFRLEDISALNVGDVVAADTFASGDKVDITGILTTYSGQYQLTLNDDSAESVRIAY